MELLFCPLVLIVDTVSRLILSLQKHLHALEDESKGELVGIVGRDVLLIVSSFVHNGQESDSVVALRRCEEHRPDRVPLRLVLAPPTGTTRHILSFNLEAPTQRELLTAQLQLLHAR